LEPKDPIREARERLRKRGVVTGIRPLSGDQEKPQQESDLVAQARSRIASASVKGQESPATVIPPPSVAETPDHIQETVQTGDPASPRPLPTTVPAPPPGNLAESVDAKAIMRGWFGIYADAVEGFPQLWKTIQAVSAGATPSGNNPNLRAKRSGIVAGKERDAREMIAQTASGESPTAGAAQFVRQFAPEIPQDYANSVRGQIMQGVGSVGAFGTMAAINPLLGLGTGSSAMGASGVKAAKSEGATDPQLVNDAVLNMMGGLLESIPAEAMLARGGQLAIKRAVASDLLEPMVRRLNKLPEAKRKAVSVALGTLEEMSQETFQAIIANIARQDQNPEVEITEGVAEQGGIGGAVGGIVATLTQLLPGKHSINTRSRQGAESDTQTGTDDPDQPSGTEQDEGAAVGPVVRGDVGGDEDAEGVQQGDSELIDVQPVMTDEQRQEFVEEMAQYDSGTLERVAASGQATDEQIQMIRDEIARRASEPDSEDPSEYAKNISTEELEDAVENARDVFTPEEIRAFEQEIERRKNNDDTEAPVGAKPAKPDGITPPDQPQGTYGVSPQTEGGAVPVQGRTDREGVSSTQQVINGGVDVSIEEEPPTPIMSPEDANGGKLSDDPGKDIGGRRGLLTYIGRITLPSSIVGRKIDPDEADLELDRIEIKAERGDITGEWLASTSIAQGMGTGDFAMFKKSLYSNPKQTIQAIRDGIDKARGAKSEKADSVVPKTAKAETPVPDRGQQTGGIDSPGQEVGDGPNNQAASSDQAVSGDSNRDELTSGADTDPETLPVRNVPIASIQTDEGRFQPREALFSEETAKKVATEYDPAKFDPILLWKDPDTGNLIVLGGHSRLEGMKRRGATNIQAKVAEVSEDEARRLAATDNDKATQLEDYERAVYIRGLREQGKTKKEIKEEAESLYGKNAPTVIAYSYLNPEGKALAAVRQFRANTSGEGTDASVMAKWVGEVMGSVPGLSKSQENEIWDYLKAVYKQRDNARTQAGFVDFVRGHIERVSTFGQIPERLNLDRIASKSLQEIEIDRQVRGAEKDLQDAIEQRNSKQNDFNKQKEESSDLTDADVVRALMPYNDAIKAAQANLIRIKQEAGRATREVKNTQSGLFGAIDPAPINDNSIKNDAEALRKAGVDDESIQKAEGQSEATRKRVESFTEALESEVEGQSGPEEESRPSDTEADEVAADDSGEFAVPSLYYEMQEKGIGQHPLMESEARRAREDDTKDGRHKKRFDELKNQIIIARGRSVGLPGPKSWRGAPLMAIQTVQGADGKWMWYHDSSVVSWSGPVRGEFDTEAEAFNAAVSQMLQDVDRYADDTSTGRTKANKVKKWLSKLSVDPTTIDPNAPDVINYTDQRYPDKDLAGNQRWVQYTSDPSSLPPLKVKHGATYAKGLSKMPAQKKPGKDGRGLSHNEVTQIISWVSNKRSEGVPKHARREMELLEQTSGAAGLSEETVTQQRRLFAGVYYGAWRAQIAKDEAEQERIKRKSQAKRGPVEGGIVLGDRLSFVVDGETYTGTAWGDQWIGDTSIDIIPDDIYRFFGTTKYDPNSRGRIAVRRKDVKRVKSPKIDSANPSKEQARKQVEFWQAEWDKLDGIARKMNKKLGYDTKQIKSSRELGAISRARQIVEQRLDEARSVLTRVMDQEDAQSKKIDKAQSELDSLWKDFGDKHGGKLSAGFDPQIAADAARIAAKYAELGYFKFRKYADDAIRMMGEKIRPYLRGAWIQAKTFYAQSGDADMIAMAVKMDDPDTQTEQDNDARIGRDMEADRANGEEPSGRNEGSDDAAGGGVGGSDRQTGVLPAEDGIQPESGVGVPGSTGVDTDLFGGAASSDTTGSGNDSDSGAQQSIFDDAERAPVVRRTSGGTEGGVIVTRSDTDAAKSDETSSGIESRLRAQQEAEGRGVVPADAANIAETVPMLLPEQQEDVLKAETRFEGGGKGFLFTNATGTGKTFTGLGIAKRYSMRGLGRILIVVPTDKKVEDWIQDGKMLNLDISRVEDTTSRLPQGAIITTYANFRQNKEIEKEGFDLVLYDESHKLNQGQNGNLNSGTAQHFITTAHPDWAIQKIVKSDAKSVRLREELDGLHDQQSERAWEIRSEMKAREEELARDAENISDHTKVVFLSATPFGYHGSITYAEGYLFRADKEDDGGYNSSSGLDAYLQANLGYRMRYGKLTRPESGVDQALLERELFERWVRDGVASTRKLEIDRDYSRDFVKVPGGIGVKIDEGIEFLVSGEGRDKYGKLAENLRKKRWTFLSMARLLEGIKAEAAVDRISKHLELGRQVIVFHGYNKGRPEHPFHPKDADTDVMEEYQMFKEERPDLANLDIQGHSNVIDTITQAFGEENVLLFNGKVSKRDRRQNVSEFNSGNAKIIVVQVEAGKEGISLHDKKGDSQRVVMQLGLPVRPTDATQTEGRAYRWGSASDAIFEYPVLGLNFERYIYSDKTGPRTGTAENLAMGNLARGLEVAFKEGYLGAEAVDPNVDQGVGGKDLDSSVVETSEFDRARTLYYMRKKRDARTKSAEGIDYYATPEPLGYKMVEWAGLQPNDDVLEPSAGHGAIARFLPATTNNTLVEPSYALGSELSINAEGNHRMIRFEELHVGGNKFDAILMNPPFGKGGKTAMEHVAKAYKHLRDGGRIIAIVPGGPSMDRRVDKWVDSDESNGAVITWKVLLPSVTFERAGTKVMTHLVIIDKHLDTDRSDRANSVSRSPSTISADSIEDFFSRIQDMGVPDRIPVMARVEAVEKGGSIAMSGMTVTKTTTVNGKDVWEVSGDTYPFKDVLRAAGGRFYRPKKVWSFYDGDPTKRINELLNGADNTIVMEGDEGYFTSPSVRELSGRQGTLKPSMTQIELFRTDFEVKRDLFATSRKDQKNPKRRVGNKEVEPKGHVRLAKAIADEIIEYGTSLIIGKKASTPEDLADLAQIYRDPRVETMRVVVVKDGVVVGHVAFSSRSPNYVNFDKETIGTPDGFVRHVVTSHGGDGYYLIHNHPSGRPAPSRPDIALTHHVSSNVPGFLGHIVIDSSWAAIIRPELVSRLRMITDPLTGMRYLSGDMNPDDYYTRHHIQPENRVDASAWEPASPHGLIGRQIYGTADVEGIATDLKAEAAHIGSKTVAIVLRGSRGDVVGITTVPMQFLDMGARFRAYIRSLKRTMGAPDAIVVGVPEPDGSGPVNYDSVASLIRDHSILDAVAMSGWSYRADGVNPDSEDSVKTNIVRVAEPHPGVTKTERFKEWFGESKVVGRDGSPAVLYHGTVENFDTFKHGASRRRDKGWFGYGFYLTGSPDMASSYAAPEWGSGFQGDRGGGRNVMPLYAAIQNPFYVDIKGLSINDQMNYTDQYGGPRAFTDYVKEKGHDGVIVSRGNATKEGTFFEVVVFDPAQVKSATGNNGDFNPQTQLILFEPGAEYGTSRDAYKAEIEMEDSTGSRGVSALEVMDALAAVVRAAGLHVPFRHGKMGPGGKRSHGFFKTREGVIRTQDALDLITATHEMGHALEKAVYGWLEGSPFNNSNGFTKEMRAELLEMGKALYGDRKPNGGYKREGWAEYIRYLIGAKEGRPQEVAPNLHRWFTTVFLQENPKVAARLETARKLTVQYQKQGAVKRVTRHIEGTDRAIDRVKRIFGTGFLRRAMDFVAKEVTTGMQPLYRLSKEAEKSLGRPLASGEDPFIIAEAHQKTHDAVAEFMVRFGTKDINGNTTGESLEAALETIPKTRKARWEFTAYLYARRAMALWEGVTNPDADGKRKEREPRNPGISYEDAKFVFEKLDSPEFRLAAERVYAWNQRVLEYADPVFGGSLSETTFSGDVGNYIPLKRVFEEMDDAARRASRSKMGGDPLQRLKGSGRRIQDPFTSMIAKAALVVRKTHERQIVNSIVRLYEKAQDLGGLVEQIPRTRLPVQVSVTDVLAQLEEIGFDPIALLDAIPNEVIDALDENPEAIETALRDNPALQEKLTFWMPNFNTPDGSYVAMPTDEGVKWYWMDKSLMEALGALDPTRLHWSLDLTLGTFARTFRLGATGLQPAFALLTNPERDTPTLFSQSITKAGPVKMLGALARSFAEGFMVQMGRDRSKYPYYNLFYGWGLEMAQFSGQDVRAQKRAARRLFEGKAVRIIDPRNWVDFLRDILQIPETANRITELRLILDEAGWRPGDPIDEDLMFKAKLGSKRVTTDFTSQGRIMQVINQVVPFVTATIGGQRAFVRSFKTNPKRAATARLVYAIAAILYWWERKDEEWYKDLDPDLKYTYYFFPMGDEVIMVPRQHEWGGAFFTIPEAIFDSAYRENPETVMDAMSHLSEMMNPLGLPVPAQVIWEQGRNWRDFWDRPIVPLSLQRKPPEEQFTPYTAGLAVELGRIFGVSPLRIEHAIYGVFAGIGRDVMDLYDLMNPRGDRVEREQEPADLYVVGRQFARGGKAGTSSRSKAIDDLYDALGEARVRSASDANPEKPDERARRLMLEDAADALSLVSFFRNQETDNDRVRELTILQRRIAKTALDAASAGPEAVRNHRAQYDKIAPPKPYTPGKPVSRENRSVSAENADKNEYPFEMMQTRFNEVILPALRKKTEDAFDE